jgi:alpha-N-arabinofuranosidase
VEEPNIFGTDEFITWCRLIGAEPYICTNAGTGTPEEMSDWVEYCNLASLGRWARLRQANGYREPHRVRYWSIGNENYGAWEIGAKTGDEWGHFVAESAKMMRRADPSIKLLAAAVPDLDWTLSLLRHAGEYLDYVSIHGYWDPLWRDDNPSDYSSCIVRSGETDAVIRTTERIIALAGFDGRIGIAFDEWNLRGWHHPLPLENSRDGVDKAIGERDRNDISATYTMADAVFSAGFLNTCLRHSQTVRMANMAPVVNARGPLFVHPEGIVKRTTFHLMAMYTSLLAENVADAWVTSDPFVHSKASVPALDAVATCGDEMRCWRLALVNRHPEHKLACTVVFRGKRLVGTHKATVLSGDSPDAYNDVEHPDRVVPAQSELEFTDGVVALPPHSVTVLRIG